MDNLLSLIGPFLPQFYLSITVWLTYGYIVWRGGFVSDDLMGIAEYDGKLQGFEYGMISRWARYHLAGGHFPSGQYFLNPDGSKGANIPQGKIPLRHHLLSVLVLNLAVVFLYPFLSAIAGDKVAFLGLVLFIVHPVLTQAVAWCSGLGYPLCLMWMALSFNLVLHFQSIQVPSIEQTVLWSGLFLLLQFLAINALFVGLMAFPILLFMGAPYFAILSVLVSIVLGLQIVRDTIKYRKKAFEEQAMGKSTFVKPRKLIVALKTLAYYIYLIIFPSRMGLYHEWGYHYDDKAEREDWRLLAGIAIASGMAYIFFGPFSPTLKFSVLWFTSFLFIFLNWITIQQFVTERYVMIPVLGFCLAVSYFLQDYPVVYALIIGLFLMRTWTHLPTYRNELTFYLSNVWNFGRSEVAHGNLGVTYLRIGQIGKALDTWHEAIRINPEYDVPYYNIFSHYRGNAMMKLQHGEYQEAMSLLNQGLPYIQKCVSCKICHMKDLWTKEYNEIKSWVENPMNLILQEEKRQIDLQTKLMKEHNESQDPKRRHDINLSLVDIANRLKHIGDIKSQNQKSSSQVATASSAPTLPNSSPTPIS